MILGVCDSCQKKHHIQAVLVRGEFFFVCDECKLDPRV